MFKSGDFVKAVIVAALFSTEGARTVQVLGGSTHQTDVEGAVLVCPELCM